MSSETTFVSATPTLASLDIQRSVEFFCSILGFSSVHMQQGQYGIVSRGPVAIHFWACNEPHNAANTSCRVRVRGIAALYAQCQLAGIVHPHAALDEKPWGSREFGILDPDSNLVTFCEWTEA